jgi:hypothetical protein
MYSKGISWIDDCRIPFEEGDGLLEHQVKYGIDSDYGKDSNTKFGQIKNSVICGSSQGRFPANILVSDDMLNDGVISKSTIFDGTLMDMTGGNFGNTNNKQTDKRIVGGYADKGTNSRYYDIDKWFDKLLE